MSTEKPFLHKLADIQTTKIGHGTRVWQYTVILPGASIGSDCNICSHCFIENDVEIGSRVTIKCGVHLWDGLRIEDDVFVGPNASFTNDLHPRSRQHPRSFPTTTIEQGASIGANATILPGLRIGRKAMVAAGAVVTNDVPAYSIVKGNPARISGYESSEFKTAHDTPRHDSPTKCIRGIDLIPIKRIEDLRGDLIPLEIEKSIPHTVRRVFFVVNVPSQRIRGEHAHRACHQTLLCVQGSVSVHADNGLERQVVHLNTPEELLHLEPMTWASQFHYSPNAVLVVFASHSYDSTDYIREYSQFIQEVGVK